MEDGHEQDDPREITETGAVAPDAEVPEEVERRLRGDDVDREVQDIHGTDA